ncbi:hypothetical protein K488DRAFT_57619, partial [Vararia minispora EC-137]
FGNQFRGCGCYVRVYFTGKKTDCGSRTCALSTAHMHKTTKVCSCSRVTYEDRRVINLFQEPCDDCKEAKKRAFRL